MLTAQQAIHIRCMYSILAQFVGINAKDFRWITECLPVPRPSVPAAHSGARPVHSAGPALLSGLHPATRDSLTLRSSLGLHHAEISDSVRRLLVIT